MNILRNLARFFALDLDDRRWFVRSVFALAQVDAMLRLLGFRRTLSRIERYADTARQPHLSPSIAPPDHARRYAHWLDLASRHHVVPAHCLHRSLALHRWLRRDGLDSKLRIGVCKVGQELKAHAWVELDGQVINDPPSAIAPFTPLVDARAWLGATHSIARFK